MRVGSSTSDRRPEHDLRDHGLNLARQVSRVVQIAGDAASFGGAADAEGRLRECAVVPDYIRAGDRRVRLGSCRCVGCPRLPDQRGRDRYGSSGRHQLEPRGATRKPPSRKWHQWDGSAGLERYRWDKYQAAALWGPLHPSPPRPPQLLPPLSWAGRPPPDFLILRPQSKSHLAP